MAFTRNRPTANELLKNSQPLIRSNFNDSDDSFGTEHYAFSDTTANNGLHKKVTTTPLAHPVTATNPIFYSAQDSANIGYIQYSRGPVFNGYVPAPTPVTRLHSSVTPITIASGGTTNILDLTGLNNLVARLYVSNFRAGNTANDSILRFIMTSDVYFFNDAGTPRFRFIPAISSGTLTTSNVFPTSSGFILQVGASGTNLANVFWSLELIRINT